MHVFQPSDKLHPNRPPCHRPSHLCACGEQTLKEPWRLRRQLSRILPLESHPTAASSLSHLRLYRLPTSLSASNWSSSLTRLAAAQTLLRAGELPAIYAICDQRRLHEFSDHSAEVGPACLLTKGAICTGLSMLQIYMVSYNAEPEASLASSHLCCPL